MESFCEKIVSNTKQLINAGAPGLKPDWLEEINSLSVKNSNILL